MSNVRHSLGLRIEEFTSRDNRPGWCSSSATEMRGELTDRSKSKHCIVRHWSTLARLMSLSLVIVTWSLVLTLMEREDRKIGYYMVFLTTLVTFFETMFILHRLFCGVERKNTKLHHVWDFLLGVTTWKKLLLYVLLTIPAFVNPKERPLTLACGIVINLIGIIDFIHLFRDRTERKPIRYQQLGVL